MNKTIPKIAKIGIKFEELGKKRLEEQQEKELQKEKERNNKKQATEAEPCDHSVQQIQ